MHSDRRRSIGIATGFAALSLLLSAVPAAAQTLRGRVLEAESGTALAEAVVLIFAGSTLIEGVQSDSIGTFEVALPAAGEYTLTASRAGFIDIGPAAFTASAGRVLDVTLRMSNTVVVLDPLSVNAVPRMSRDRALRRSAQNRRLGIGLHMNMDEIEKSTLHEAGELLASMALQVRYVDIRPRMVPNGRGGYSVAAGEVPQRVIGVTRFGRFCPLALFVDGVPVGRGDTSVLPHPAELVAVEVYTGTAVQDGFVDVGGCGFALLTTGPRPGANRYRRTLLGSAVLGAMLGVFLLAR